ncbi:hypothetical protein [Chitiniphilus shinanonensis]|uniref:hypothetical protein n=1 Tax=Chitiniphilus shinanonensis TaxID=553088 RepID=UPI0012FC91F5|nr:hypothetical protein [Chitiniphilus shinanonensis]
MMSLIAAIGMAAIKELENKAQGYLLAAIFAVGHFHRGPPARAARNTFDFAYTPAERRRYAMKLAARATKRPKAEG